MDPHPDRKARFSLFVTILTLFLSAALLVGAGVTVSDYVQNRRTAIRVAADTFKEKIGRINERRLAFFASPFLIVEQLHDDPVLLQSAGSKDAILKSILSGLRMNPHISAVYAGYENGNYFQVLSISDAEKFFIDRLGAPQATRSLFRTSGPTMALAGKPGSSSMPAALRSGRWTIKSPAMTPAAAIGIATRARSRKRSSATTRMSSQPPLRSE